jgi:hypothetical protein
VVVDTPSGPTWFPESREAGWEQMFAAVGTYVVIGGCIALVVGLLVGLLTRGREYVGLLIAVVAAVVGAVVMYRVGVSLSPPDPIPLAAEVDQGERLPGSLAFEKWIPLLVWPAGSLFSYLTVVVLAPLDRHVEPSPQTPAPPLPPYAT